MLDAEDIESARTCLVKAGLSDLVESMRGNFTLAEILDVSRTPPALMLTRHRIWKAAYEQRDSELGVRLHSLNELGRLFNRDHTTILSSMRKRGTHGTTRPEQG